MPDTAETTEAPTPSALPANVQFKTPAITPQEGEPTKDVQEAPEAEMSDAVREEIRKRNSENRNLRERLKVAEEKASQLDKLTEASKTAEERAAEERESLARENGTLKQQLLRLKVGTELNLPAALIARLNGETEDELREDAKSLRELIPGQPSRAPNPGQRATADASSSKDALARQFFDL